MRASDIAFEGRKRDIVLVFPVLWIDRCGREDWCNALPKLPCQSMTQIETIDIHVPLIYVVCMHFKALGAISTKVMFREVCLPGISAPESMIWILKLA